MHYSIEPRNRLFSILIALEPIFSYYSFANFKIIPVGDALLVVASVIMLLFRANLKKIKIFYYGLPLPVFIVIRQLLTGSNAYISTTVHILLYYIFLSIILVSLDNNVDVKPSLLVALVSSLFIILQTIVYRASGVYLSGTLTFFEPLDYVVEFETYINSHQFDVLRPRSFFSEPATYSVYTSIALAIVIPDFLTNRNKTILALIYTSGLIASLSSTGIVLCILLWGYWLIMCKKIEISKKLTFAIVILFVIFIICIFYRDRFDNWFNFFIDHTTGAGFEGRLGAWKEIKLYTKNPIAFFFGNAIFDHNSYFPEIIKVPLFWGMSGIVMLIPIVKYLFTDLYPSKYYFIIICISLCVIGSFFFCSFTPFLFSMIVACKTKGEIVSNESLKKWIQ